MKIRSSLLFIPAVLLSVFCGAQTLNDRTLLTVAGNNVSAGEFIRMFKKSAEPLNKADIDTYLQQYIIFKLKVADALHEGYDTTRAFKTELNGYRNQLAQNYLTDNQVKEKILQKIYQRSLTEIDACHILVNCPEDASPEDTLIAWNKATGIRERIIKGEPFEQVARGSSDDKSVKINGGDLGYFTVFQMIMPFEDAAYILREGVISQPVRTPFGYHIIKVIDKRPSRGKVLIAHIMKASPPGTEEKEEKEIEESINSIYNELQSGESFYELAKKYSEHKESAANGGKLDWFGTGEIIPALSEVAFSITDTGKYSKPVRTIYAWHIIKLLDKKGPGTYEETKSYLESKLNQSYLNSLSRKSFINKLKNEYKFRINQTAYNWFVKNTDTLIISGKTKYKRSSLPSGYLYSFANQHLTTKEFASNIEKRGSMIVTDNPAYFISRSIDEMISDQIIKYENSLLEDKYPDFRYLMKEFHDGILLFEISGKNVWDRVQEDSVGLRDYYEKNRQKYLTKKGIDAKIYTLRSSKGEKKLSTYYKKYSQKPETDMLLKKKFNRENDSLLVITEGKWFAGDNPDLDTIKWTKGTQIAKIRNYPSLIVINEVINPEPLPFEAVKGEMMNGYQEYLENEWEKQLKERYSVKIDQQVLAEVRKSLVSE